MKIIAGLGNPGAKYETTRHNAGFLAIDRLIERFNASGPQDKYKSDIYEAQIAGEKTLLIKPRTYMNLSGKAIGPLLQFYKVDPSSLVVIHDEIDLKPLTLRIKSGGGPGGHNGIRSIDECVGKANNHYYRIRIGVGKPGLLGSGERSLPVEDYVLQPFTDQELKDLDPLLDDVADAAEKILAGQVTEAMNLYNRKQEREKTNGL